jgi:Ankyrin repeats (3 copies)
MAPPIESKQWNDGSGKIATSSTASQSYLTKESQHLICQEELGGPTMIQRKPNNKARKESKEKRKTKKKPIKEDIDKNKGRGSTSTPTGMMAVKCMLPACTAVPGSPLAFIITELRKVSPEGTFPCTYPSLKMKDTFSIWTKEQIEAYDKDAISAVRSRDVALMRSWHESGRTLQAANIFGESLLHMACRRGFLEVVKFLVDDCGHDLWVRDDTGRTPMHDAFWTPEPQPELIDYILAKDCDMVLVTDKRGHTPPDYARKDHWEFWIDHFRTKDLMTLLPRRGIFYSPLATASIPDADLRQFMTELKIKETKKAPRRQSLAATAVSVVLSEESHMGGPESTWSLRRLSS